MTSKDEAKLSAAQHNEHEVRLRVDGENRLVPKDSVDPDKVELKFNDSHGHYLVPDDGNPHNDLIKFNEPKPTPEAPKSYTNQHVPAASEEYNPSLELLKAYNNEGQFASNDQYKKFAGGDYLSHES